MASLANSFEGGSNGVTITTGNSGGASGDAFGAAVVDSSLTYTTATAAHGSVCALASGSSDAYVAWTSGLTGTSATAYARAYLRFNTLPGANVNILRMLSSSNGIMGTIRINSAGTLGMLYGTGSLGGNTSVAVTAGSWFRVEIKVTAGGASNGEMVMRVYWTPDATTPDQTITSSGVTTGAVNPTRLRCGILSSSAAVHVDDLAFGDVDWIGPVAGGGTSEPAGTATAVATARPAGKAKTRAVPPASTVDTAQHLGRRKTLPLDVAAAVATAQPLGKAKHRTLSAAAATDTAEPITSATATTQPLTTAPETDQAQPLGKTKTRALAPAAAVATAAPVGARKPKPVGTASGTSTAQPLGRVKHYAVEPASEADTAVAVTVPDATIEPLTADAAETDTARPLARNKRRAVALAGQTVTALPVGRRKARTLPAALSAAAARPAGHTKTRRISAAAEADTAQPVTTPSATAAAGRGTPTLTSVSTAALAETAVPVLTGYGSEASLR